jgi:N-sulfoglucosamine sulfohydrolase
LRSDPACLANLAAEPAQAARKRQLREWLFDALEAQGDPRMLGQGRIFDEYPYSDPRSRNFYRRFMLGEAPNAGWVEPTDFEETVPE